MDAKPLTAAIVGAGPIGAMAALALHQQGWQVRLFERETLTAAQPLPSSYDERQLALTPQSVDWLVNQLGLTQLSAQLTPILSIHTSSKGHFGQMMMTAQQQGVDALGYTIAQRQLGEILFQALAGTNIELLSGVTLTQCTQDEQSATSVILSGTLVEAMHHWSADYLFAADGANSWVRQQLNIHSHTRPYTHRLMTCVATLAEPHNNLAIERFTANGPTALLPLADAHQTKLVYCYAEAEATQVEQLDHAALIAAVNAQLEQGLPKVVDIHAVYHYPLAEVRPASIQQGHVLLIGNAAHTQHPVAGQGLNLGIRDVQAVMQWANKTNPANPTAWTALATARLQDHRRIMGATHGLVSLFTHSNGLVRSIASAGISLVNWCTPLKKRITRLAMGY